MYEIVSRTYTYFVVEALIMDTKNEYFKEKQIKIFDLRCDNPSLEQIEKFLNKKLKKNREKVVMINKVTRKKVKYEQDYRVFISNSASYKLDEKMVYNINEKGEEKND